VYDVGVDLSNKALRKNSRRQSMRSLLVITLAWAGLSTWTVLCRGDNDTKKKSAEGDPGFLGIHLTLTGEEAMISGFVDHSPAKKAGLKVGDVIVKIQDKPIKEVNDLMEVMQKTKPGDKIAITVKREGKEKTVTVTLGTKPKAND
jgi:S1-C subfamily serine protease